MATTAISSAEHQLSADERAIVGAVVDQAPSLTESARASLAALLSGTAKADRFTDALRVTIAGGVAR